MNRAALYARIDLVKFPAAPREWNARMFFFDQLSAARIAFLPPIY